MSPKDDDGEGNDAANAAADFADAVSPIEREGPLSACLRPRNVVASLSVMETPPMEMFKSSLGVEVLLKGEDMVTREGGDLGARWIWTNNQDFCHCRWVDLEVGERCVTEIVMKSRWWGETGKGDTNLAFIVETEGTGGSCKTG